MSAKRVSGKARAESEQKRFDDAGRKRYQVIMSKKGEPRHDTCWRKSRIAARILRREAAGKLTPRDVALGRKLAADNGVTPRLIDQALYGFSGQPYRVGVALRKKA